MSEAVCAVTNAPEQTEELAAAFAACCQPNDVVGLQGTLGVGKTCFVRGLARGLGSDDRVVSPTFVLMRVYDGRLTLYHFDAYRLADASDMEAIGCAETFESGGVSIVEWAGRVAGCLPPQRFLLSIRVGGPTQRRFRLTAQGKDPRARLDAFRRVLAPWAP